MAKVTSKYQVTVPKAIADRYHICPGDHIEWVPAGDVIRAMPARRAAAPDDEDSRLRIFDQAKQSYDRGWRREDLYGRGRSG
jgi:AbrB family looped-hinge helix DNA binding protein